MALINVENVEILNNPCRFLDDFQLKITFECLPPGIQEELDWKIIYVGSAMDEKYDQILDEVSVGPVVIGRNEFIMEAPPPDPELIPKTDMVSLTVILLTGSYKENEFIRIGYYLNNLLNGVEMEWTEDDLNKYTNTGLAHLLQRNVAVSQPRITRFPIDWDSPNTELLMPQQQQDNSNQGLGDTSSAAAASSSSSSAAAFASVLAGVARPNTAATTTTTDGGEGDDDVEEEDEDDEDDDDDDDDDDENAEVDIEDEEDDVEMSQPPPSAPSS